MQPSNCNPFASKAVHCPSHPTGICSPAASGLGRNKLFVDPILDFRHGTKNFLGKLRQNHLFFSKNIKKKQNQPLNFNYLFIKKTF